MREKSAGQQAPLSGSDGTSLTGLLCALSFASDLAMGQPMEHGLKSAHIGLQIADHLNLGNEDREAIFYGSLLKDAGCTACAAVFAALFDGNDLGPRRDCLLLKPGSMKSALAWFWRHAPQDQLLPARIAATMSFLVECNGVFRESVVAHCEVGELFGRRLGLPPKVQEALRFHWERWDGKSLAFGRKGAEIPLASRIIRLAQVAQVAYALGGRSAATATVKERAGTEFDPELCGAFLQIGLRADFWRVIDLEDAKSTILQMRPTPEFDQLTNDRVSNVCEVLADFADAKSRASWDHSHLVAGATALIARHMGLTATQAQELRLAALVHDIGKVAVPVRILDKKSELTPAEWERFRLHPHYTGLVLSRVEPLRNLAADAAAHHERMDGRGYHRQLRGDGIPLGGRILAIADVYADLHHRMGDRPSPEDVVLEMKPLAGEQLDSECYEAFTQSIRGAPAPRRPRPTSGPSLSERELEVLRLVAGGLSNRSIAHELVISEKTVESHIDHIFNKLGVSTRTSAAVYSMHHGLLSP